MKRIFLFFFILYFFVSAFALDDPLPSWNEGIIKHNLIQFVQSVTDPHNTSFVKPEERIATIDNDGTLWVEQPLYTQALFAIQRVKALSSQHPEWKTQPPFNAIINNDQKAIMNFSAADAAQILAATHAGMTPEQFESIAKTWLTTYKHPKFNRPPIQLIYQPMLEVIHYLKKNHFKVYIVTGGGQDFVRAFGTETYGIPSEQTIGTSGQTHYTYLNNKPVLIKLPKILLITNEAGKVEGINLFIGKKPVIALGNSDGDRQMLEWAQSRPGPHFMALVHHDDATREYAYDTQSKVGTFSASLMEEAEKNKWNVISMKHDWKVIFPFEMNS